MAKYQAILFDLDGTLINPKEGITKSIQFALEKLGAPIPSPNELEWCIGPPLRESFSTLIKNASADQIDQALDYYRSRYRDIGMYEHFVYPGIKEMLSQLHLEGYPLFIATAKPQVFAAEIAKNLGFDGYFTKIHGAELDGTRTDKGELIQYIVESHSIQEPAVMVGDRKYDIEGALSNGLHALGVTYGYGSHEELKEAGSHHLCHSPHEVYRWIVGASTIIC